MSANRPGDDRAFSYAGSLVSLGEYSCDPAFPQAMALEGESWRSAFAVRSVAGNATVAFGLDDPCRMTDQSGVGRLSGWRHKADRVVNAQYGRRAIRAFLQWRRKFRCMT